ncbi:MAG TPA: hypothetical protein VJ957_00790 [Longimicrobiales bacterium]|nr:hypothetical protein [Longimicrobiales bacterium]
MRSVARAFQKLEPVTLGLAVGIKGSMTDGHRVEDPERGVVLALEPEPGGTEVQLQVGLRGGRLLARSALRGNAGGAGELEDHLRLDLRAGYRWGDVEYPDADAFAAALLSHMRRRSVAVGQVEPVVSRGAQEDLADGPAHAERLPDRLVRARRS